MTVVANQLELFRSPGLAAAIEKEIFSIANSQGRPSANELVEMLDNKVGIQARLDVVDVLRKLVQSSAITSDARRYFKEMLDSGDMDKALRGPLKKRPEIESSIDELLRASNLYRSSQLFREMIEFMGKFREYSPYNNMLVRVQNPACSFYATARDWRDRFGRHLKEDARPMVILAPMHPILLVYDLDNTDGGPLPKELEDFARVEGPWEDKWLANLVENARRHRVKVSFKSLSKTLGGFAQAFGHSASWKCRIAIHEGLDAPSRFGVLCHELAHVFLGHVGGDEDAWWPTRTGVGRRAAEVEAEGVAYIVAARFGLMGTSAAYISGYATDGEVPKAVSIDHIGKVAGRIQSMARGLLPAPRQASKSSSTMRAALGAT